MRQPGRLELPLVEVLGEVRARFIDNFVMVTLYIPGGMPGSFPTVAMMYLPLLSVMVENDSRFPPASTVL